MEVQIADLDALEASLQRALDRIGELRAGTRVSSEELFAEPFMRQHTQYDSFSRFREDAPIDFSAPVDDVSKESHRRLNAFVSETTAFETWEQMETQAAEEEIVEQLLSDTA